MAYQDTPEKRLARLVQRRHPLYVLKKEHWDFVEATYEGGRDWFDDNIFRYFKEGDAEYTARVKRAYRFNHTRQVVDLVTKYIFKQEVDRKQDAPEYVKKFWAKATRQGLDITSYAKQISEATSKFGKVWVVVDSTLTEQESSQVTRADEKSGNGMIYSYWLRPQQVLDMGYDDDGDGSLLWFLFHELHRDDTDPFLSSGRILNRYRLWTRTQWFLFEERPLNQTGSRTEIVQIDQGVNALGVVPVFPANHEHNEERYAASGMVDDVAYLDRANANYLSNLDAIIQDQTFSQLAMPGQALMHGTSEYQQAIEAGTKRVFIYNGEGGARPEFLSPDVKQAELIIKAIGKIINEIYHSVGLSAERTKEDNGGGIDNASGVAKAYDFERINGALVAKANALSMFEARLLTLVSAYAGESMDIEEARELVTYPRTFDVRNLYDEFEIAARLSLLSAPDELRREQMRLIVTKLMPALEDKRKEEINKALESWPPPELLGPEGVGGGSKNPVSAALTQRAAKELAT